MKFIILYFRHEFWLNSMKNHFMRRLFMLILMFGFSFKLTLPVHAQFEGDFMDLLLLYVDEKYDICFHKSIKYTEKDKTKKHPLPYLYVSMSSYEMSQRNQYTNIYPKAYKTAISYLSKYRKKDKGYEFKEDSEDYIEKIKLIVAEEVENYLSEGTESTHSKAASLVKKICSIDPNDYGSKLLYAHLCFLTKNKSIGKEYLKISLEYIKNLPNDKFAFKKMTKSQQYYLRYSIMEYANYQKNKKPAEAKITINLGEEYFCKERDDCHLEDNEEFINLHKHINSL